MRRKIESARQGNKNVDQFINEMVADCVKYDKNMSDGQIIDFILNGIDPHYEENLIAFRDRNLIEFADAARRLESAKLKNWGKTKDVEKETKFSDELTQIHQVLENLTIGLKKLERNQSNGKTFQKRFEYQGRNNSRVNQEIRCAFCEKKGYLVENCWKKQRLNSGRVTFETIPKDQGHHMTLKT